jgi:lysyl-tRNA synthetase class 2
VEPALAGLDRPVFLLDYPITQAALARPSPSDPAVAERFELYAGGIELSNGYGELRDPVEQARRFAAERAVRRASKRPVYPVDRRFLAALREGMPPASGNALGVDRLVLLLTGAASVAEVIAFPNGW